MQICSLHFLKTEHLMLITFTFTGLLFIVLYISANRTMIVTSPRIASGVNGKQYGDTHLLEDKLKNIVNKREMNYFNSSISQVHGICEKSSCSKKDPGVAKQLELKVSNIRLKHDIVNYGVQQGGVWIPKNCEPASYAAIVVPFRLRHEHLVLWLHNVIPHLQQQNIAFRIFVIEQRGESLFNRGKLFNVGFVEASKLWKFDCVITHDVDLIPEMPCVRYRCYDQPFHIGVAVSKYNYTLLYEQIVGGILSMKSSTFRQINGYSNLFYGWGGEDDEMYQRILLNDFTVIREDIDVARFRSLDHEKYNGEDYVHRAFKKSYEHARNFSRLDGLNSVTYSQPVIRMHALYTNVSVDIGGPTSTTTAMENYASECKTMTEQINNQISKNKILNV